ncbi:hypothetical protein STEG23_019586, partial [Scotinomys teguina]
MTVTPLGRDQDCSLKNRELDVPAPWFLDPGGWSKTAAVSLYFIFPGICTLSLFLSAVSPNIPVDERNFGYTQEGFQKIHKAIWVMAIAIFQLTKFEEQTDPLSTKPSSQFQKATNEKEQFLRLPASENSIQKVLKTESQGINTMQVADTLMSTSLLLTESHGKR